MIRFILALALTLSLLSIWKQSWSEGIINPMENCRSSLLRTSNAVLMPLDAEGEFAEAKLRATLLALKKKLATGSSRAESRSLLEATTLLENALAERSEYMRRARMDRGTTGLDRISYQTTDQDTLAQTARNSFFSQTALRAWRERSEFYRGKIAGLLAG